MITNVKLPSQLKNCFFILGVSPIIHVSGVDVKKEQKGKKKESKKEEKHAVLLKVAY